MQRPPNVLSDLASGKKRETKKLAFRFSTVLNESVKTREVFDKCGVNHFNLVCDTLIPDSGTFIHGCEFLQSLIEVGDHLESYGYCHLKVGSPLVPFAGEAGHVVIGVPYRFQAEVTVGMRSHQL